MKSIFDSRKPSNKLAVLTEITRKRRLELAELEHECIVHFGGKFLAH